ncbi:Ammonium transporter [Moraxella catarrhalis]|nr:Ammonium transporter [Moraxella catarrhalis]OAU94863.1 Ammonium transporter [Moraxella catarrhalis]OAU99308.1 Ammonium transporter [Moraxella catarrhalis]
MNRFGKWASLSVGLGLLSASNLAYAEDVLDTGDTAWVLISTALVLMMTLPGLALFYAGMVRKKNILSTMMHSYGATAVVSVLWVIIGYSLAFSEGSFNAFVGGFDHVMLANIGLDDVSGTIPVILFVVF